MLKIGEQVDIERVENGGGYKLKLVFSDGYERIVDFERFLSASLNPVTQRFLEREAFGTYRIEWGNLVWGDYEMCFPIDDLYAGRISEERYLAVAEDRADYGGSATVE